MNNKNLIVNKNERKRVAVSLILPAAAIAVILFVVLGNYMQPGAISYRTLRGFRRLAGQAAAWGFAFSISMFVIRRIAKRMKAGEIKKNLLAAARFAREWHVPVSIAALSLILLHVYFILSRGFITDTRYVSGLAALVVLGVQLISGLFRYKRKGIKFHMVMGLTFITLMAVHLMS